MVFESTVLVLLKNWVLVVPVVLVAYLASNYFNHGLNKYPGPLLAGLTDWWRFFDVYGRRPDITHIKLHRKHGDVVRLGPNSLSFADPKAIRQIYGLNKGFVKVRTEPVRSWCLSNDKNISPVSIQCRWLFPKDSGCHHCSRQPMNRTTRIFDGLSTALSP
jgi:hypothetical protein